ncbi:MAG: hypothetical protein K2Q13_00240 [Nitrosomonas sp.]|uniref:hypothetical protein n=1 Tax=Nitrosomonas sp. TaxID=42353 RepID=UPI002600D979|nr:hypothetical protein [Nitrosomonas sp.]MBY0473473.1 hypothetical protein [Nitrosomonas sp.]
MQKNKWVLRTITLSAALSLLSGCWTMAAVGAGAYGGYKMKEKGYTLQSPITKERKSRK